MLSLMRKQVSKTGGILVALVLNSLHLLLKFYLLSVPLLRCSVVNLALMHDCI